MGSRTSAAPSYPGSVFIKSVRFSTLQPPLPPSPAGVHVVAHIHPQMAEIAALLSPQIKHGIAEGEHLSVGGVVRKRGKRGKR